MRKMDKHLICVLFLFIALTLPYTGYSTEQTAERPIYSAGDYWIFINHKGKEKKIEFLREEENKYIFNKKKNIYSKEGSDIVRDLELTKINKKSHKGYPGPIVKFPLEVGKKWDYKYETKGGKRYNKLAQYKVESYEQITVTAGTFWAFKIISDVVPVNAPKGKTSLKEIRYYWYSPEVKQIIKDEKQSGKYTELKEYNIK